MDSSLFSNSRFYTTEFYHTFMSQRNPRLIKFAARVHLSENRNKRSKFLKFWKNLFSTVLTALILTACASPASETTAAPETVPSDALTFPGTPARCFWMTDPGFL